MSEKKEIKKISKREEIEQNYDEDYGLIFFDGLDDAIVGVVEKFGNDMAVLYSKKGIIDILMKDDMTHEDALEYFYYNIIGGYLGETTPVFLDDLY